MFKVGNHITIGKFSFDAVVDVEINESIETLTDTCNITINKKFEWNGKNIALGDDRILKRKDKVIVKSGWDGDFKTVFIGYLKNIKAGVPVVIECEDSMMLLKKKTITKSYENVTLKTLLEGILPAGIKFKTPGDKDIHIGQYRITKASAAQVLENLKTDYGLYSYFRLIDNSTGTDAEAVLYVGLAYWFDRGEEVVKFSGNMVDDDLTYKIYDDIEMMVKATSLLPNNTKIEIEVGDVDGEVRTVHHYNLSKAQLEVYANAELEKFKYTGYKGTITITAIPFLRKGDVANVIGNKYNPDGKYFVKSIKRNSGVKGIKQVLTIDAIVNSKTASTAAA